MYSCTTTVWDQSKKINNSAMIFILSLGRKMKCTSQTTDQTFYKSTGCFIHCQGQLDVLVKRRAIRLMRQFTHGNGLNFSAFCSL